MQISGKICCISAKVQFSPTVSLQNIRTALKANSAFPLPASSAVSHAGFPQSLAVDSGLGNEKRAFKGVERHWEVPLAVMTNEMSVMEKSRAMLITHNVPNSYLGSLLYMKCSGRYTP